MRRKLQEYPSVVIETALTEKVFDFFEIFGRAGPIHIEIGSGKGTFLLGQGQAQPEVNFLGVEWARKYYRYAVDRIGRWDLKNVRLIRTNAADFLANNVPSYSVDCFHIYFPDPWPKKRHNKRRFFNRGNLENMITCLKQAGQIRIATDFIEYFNQICELLKDNSNRLKEIDFVKPASASDNECVGTNYERKYIKEGRSIYVVAVEKI